LKNEHSRTIYSVNWSKDDKYIATGSGKERISSTSSKVIISLEFLIGTKERAKRYLKSRDTTQM
jgi:hypothetical protein